MSLAQTVRTLFVLSWIFPWDEAPTSSLVDAVIAWDLGGL